MWVLYTRKTRQLKIIEQDKQLLEQEKQIVVEFMHNMVEAVAGGGDITAESGKNTVYLCKLPDGLQKGDTVRIWAHCLTHGEYVDFIEV